MSEDHSISLWIERLKAGDALAAERLWNNYSQQLLALAHRKLAAANRKMADEEDVAQSVFDSLFRRAQEGQFAGLNDRHDLWSLLVTIADRKAKNLLRDQRRQKRGGGQVRGESVFAAQPDTLQGGLHETPGHEPTPEFAAIVSESCEQLLALLDPVLRAIALARLDGHSNEEISKMQSCSIATIERRLKLIRSLWDAWEPACETE